MTRLLIANRGEIAIRIAQTAAELGYVTIAVHSEDDAECLHLSVMDETRQIPGKGAAAYLDIEAIVQAATETGAKLLHPGYGFLSENPGLARACLQAGINFIGQNQYFPMGGISKDGSYLAPALNVTGHAWHHPDSVLFKTIKHGSIASDSSMRAFSERLSDEEIVLVIQYFKSLWPESIREKHAKFNQEEV